MAKRKPTNKYYFSVEGETEQWYLKWLQDAINNTEEASCKCYLYISYGQSQHKNLLCIRLFKIP